MCVSICMCEFMCECLSVSVCESVCMCVSECVARYSSLINARCSSFLVGKCKWNLNVVNSSSVTHS